MAFQPSHALFRAGGVDPGHQFVFIPEMIIKGVSVRTAFLAEILHADFLQTSLFP